jgi:hypothetical protein
LCSDQGIDWYFSSYGQDWYSPTAWQELEVDGWGKTWLKAVRARRFPTKTPRRSARTG